MGKRKHNSSFLKRRDGKVTHRKLFQGRWWEDFIEEEQNVGWEDEENEQEQSVREWEEDFCEEERFGCEDWDYHQNWCLGSENQYYYPNKTTLQWEETIMEDDQYLGWDDWNYYPKQSTVNNMCTRKHISSQMCYLKLVNDDDQEFKIRLRPRTSNRKRNRYRNPLPRTKKVTHRIQIDDPWWEDFLQDQRWEIFLHQQYYWQMYLEGDDESTEYDRHLQPRSYDPLAHSIQAYIGHQPGRWDQLYKRFFKSKFRRRRVQTDASVLYHDDSRAPPAGHPRWEDLIEDCLVQILNKLELIYLMGILPFVCRSWYKASLKPDSWKLLDFRFLNDLHGCSTICRDRFYWDRDYCPRSTNRYLNVYNCTCGNCNQRRESINKCIKFVAKFSRESATKVWLPRYCSMEALNYISDWCPNLISLSIPHCYFLSSECEQQILKSISKWKHLEELNLGLPGTHFQDILTQISIHCGKFETLGIIKSDIGEQETENIIQILPHIKRLILQHCKISRPHVLKILVNCMELELLDLSFSEGFDESDEWFLKMSSQYRSVFVQGFKN